MTIVPEEIPPDEMTVNYLVEMPTQSDVRYEPKFANESGVGTDEHFTLLTDPTTGEPYHYIHTFNIKPWPHLIVDAGAADLPPLRYRSLCLDLCSSGLHFLESFQHGTLFYTLEAVDEAKIATEFVTGVVQGTPWNEIQYMLNMLENDDSTIITKPHVYHQF